MEHSHSAPHGAMRLPGLLAQLYARRETVWYLVGSNLKAGQRDKVLGHLWNLLDPALFMLVYFFVFGVLFGATGGGRSGEFMLYILIGVLSWRFLASAVGEAANCIRGNRGLIHEISFPKAIFPLSISLSRMYDFMWGLVVMVVVLLIANPSSVSIHWLWAPLIALLQLMFTVGLAYLVAYAGAFFADTTNVVSVGLRLWFYSSPIFYFVRGEQSLFNRPDKPEMADYQFYYMLNPVACMLECYRDALLWARAPEAGLLLYFAVTTVVVLVAGLAVFARGERKFAKYI